MRQFFPLFVVALAMGCLGPREFREFSTYTRPVGLGDFGKLDMEFTTYEVSGSDVHYYVGHAGMSGDTFDEMIFKMSYMIEPRAIDGLAAFVAYESEDKEAVQSLMWHSDGKLFQISNSASAKDLGIMIELFKFVNQQ